MALTMQELNKIMEELKYTLVAKFGGERPPADDFDKFMNSMWGLTAPVTVSLLDYPIFSIRLQSEQDFQIALSQEATMISQRHFILLQWSLDYTKKG